MPSAVLSDAGVNTAVPVVLSTGVPNATVEAFGIEHVPVTDRKSTRLNSSHT